MTYSIIARDPETGEIGAAGQSHFFNAGALLFSAEPGVGAVATQMMPEPSYRTRALDAMRGGACAEEALRSARERDPGTATRQVAAVDAWGRVAAFTGAQCIAYSAHCLGEGVSAQAAMCTSPETARAMVSAYRESHEPLAERLLTALEAAEACGGDLRGQKAASLLVVAGSASAEPWKDRIVDLRVDDHRRPLEELRRLVGLHRLHTRANRALELALAGQVAHSIDEFEALERENPNDPDVAFRHALVLAVAGDAQRARVRLEPCYRLHDGWREVVKRLPAAGLLPDDQALLATLTTPVPPSASRSPAA
jgi:uncharacterized Ntn-hydrolase superfamily protein